MPALEGSHAAGPIFMASLLSTVAAYRLSLASLISTYGQAHSTPYHQIECNAPEAFEGHDALIRFAHSWSAIRCQRTPAAPHSSIYI